MYDLVLLSDNYIPLSLHFERLAASWETDSGLGDSPPVTPSDAEEFDGNFSYEGHVFEDVEIEAHGQLTSRHSTVADEFVKELAMRGVRHSVDYSASMLNSPMLKERFSKSGRNGTRPSTFSTVSFLGSERSPRFYEKVIHWFRRKRGRQLASAEAFPQEKHSSVHHQCCLKQSTAAGDSFAVSLNPAAASPMSLKRRPSARLASAFPTTIDAPTANSLSATFLLGPGCACSTGMGAPCHQITSIPENDCDEDEEQTGKPSCQSSTNPSPVKSHSACIRHGSTGSSRSSVGTGRPPREMSLESGYHSFSSCSSPAMSVRQQGGGSFSSLRNYQRQSRFRFLSRALRAVRNRGQSLSEETGSENGGPSNKTASAWYSMSTEDKESKNTANRRQRFQKGKLTMFHAAVDETDGGETLCSGNKANYATGQDVGGQLLLAVDNQDDANRSESRASSYSVSGGVNSVFGSSVFSGSNLSLTGGTGVSRPPTATGDRTDAHEMVAITLGEFRFNYNELEFRQTISRSVSTQIHSGKCQVWDVHIHSCCPSNDDEVRNWLADVRRLTQIRHENLVLYMGACVEPPKFAIITSLIKADSLYSALSEQGKKISSVNKLSILRQTANAFSYLHCRGIVHGRLSAHNIFLENNVKVSLLDYASNSLNFQYYSPEIIRQIDHESPYLNPAKSQMGDVFSFGTVTYLLVAGRLPLDQKPAQTVMYMMGSGHLNRCLPSIGLPQANGMEKIVERCWAHRPEDRPTFAAVCRLLQPLARCVPSIRHSSSEPRNLDQMGRGGTGLLAMHC